MKPKNPADFESAISKPRLNSYRAYFGVGLDEAIGLYMWNARVSGCLHALLAYHEVALRNSVHRALSSAHTPGANSVAWWHGLMGQLPIPTQNALVKVIGSKPYITPDEVVSRVTFGFWPTVLGKVPHYQMGAVFARTFPGDAAAAMAGWPSQARKTALAVVRELADVRNRIAHHEPLWKFSALPVPAGGGPALPASLTAADSLARFARMLALFDRSLAAISASLAADLRGCSWRRELDQLLTPRGMQRYRSQRHVPHDPPYSPADFSMNFDALVVANQPVPVASPTGSGLFVPTE